MRFLLILSCVLLGTKYTTAQCDGGSNAGSLTPTSGYQTTSFNSGDYFTINVQCGYQYYFSTSYNGGDASGNDTQITINLTDGTTDVGFDDDGGDGYESDLTWTSDFTGTIQVLITEYYCIDDGGISGTLAYNETAGTPNTDFSLSSTSCSTATATVTGDSGGTFTFNPSPGDGATIDPNSGAISNGVAGTTYTVEYTVCSSSSTETITMPGATNTFDYSLTQCDEATPVQTEGESGGVFSFTSNPGGGTSIDGTSGVISNADPGDTYSIDYEVCGITTTFNYTFPTNLSDFEMIEVCGGGVPNILGVEGGTFLFSPDPSDGSQISSTTGVVSNGVVGETYTVEYDVCSTTSTETIYITSDNCFTLNGDAQQLVINGEDCIQLTDESNSLNGCAWNGSTISFASDFSLSLDYYFGDNISGADGNTFTFQPSSSTACGNDGEQLGAGGIANALVIEFDTYQNSGEPSCDHVAITTDGNLTDGSPAAGPECAKSDGGNIDDGGVYEVEIAWDATSQTLTVYFDGDSVLSYTDDVINNVFGGASDVYWGATAATGGLNNQQYFCPSTIVILGLELNAINTYCNGANQFISWKEIIDENIDHYIIEYTYDGYIYYPYKTILVEEKDLNNDYQVSVDIATDQKYFRIKTVDRTGHFTSTELFKLEECQSTDFNISSNEGLTIQAPQEEFKVAIYDTKGALIEQDYSSSDELKIMKHLEAGVYIISLYYKDGSTASKKFFMYQ